MSTSYHLYVGPFIRIKHESGPLPDIYQAFADRNLDEEAFSNVENAEIPRGEKWLILNNRERYVHRLDSEDTGWLIGDAIRVKDDKINFAVDYVKHIVALKDVFGDDNIRIEWGLLAHY